MCTHWRQQQQQHQRCKLRLVSYEQECKKKKKEKSSRILECILHLELKHSFFTLIFVGFIFVGPRGPAGVSGRAQLASLTEGQGTLGRRRSTFSFFRVEAVMATALLIDGASVLSIPLCPPSPPDPVYHSPHLLSVENWDVTLRKYQLHCLQYHTPVWTHLLLLVGEQQRETGTETDRDTGEREETLSWSGTVILL